MECRNGAGTCQMQCHSIRGVCTKYEMNLSKLSWELSSFSPALVFNAELWLLPRSHSRLCLLLFLLLFLLLLLELSLCQGSERKMRVFYDFRFWLKCRRGTLVAGSRMQDAGLQHSAWLLAWVRLNPEPRAPSTKNPSIAPTLSAKAAAIVAFCLRKIQPTHRHTTIVMKSTINCQFKYERRRLQLSVNFLSTSDNRWWPTEII